MRTALRSGPGAAHSATYVAVDELVLNVDDHGAVGDGVTNDREAIRALIASAPTGSVIWFDPTKTYNISGGGTGEQGVVISGKIRLTLRSNGAVLKRTAALSPDGQRWMTISSCTDLIIEGLQFDANNTERFGGLNITGSTRVTVRHNRAFDSNLNASWSSYDHYWLVIQTSTDVDVHHNHATDVELIEANNNTRCRIHHNVSVTAAGTTAIGYFAVGPNYYAYDYEIEDNFIFDARKNAMTIGGVETGGIDGAILKRCRINRNTVYRENQAGVYDLQMGHFGGLVQTNCAFEDIEIRQNRFITALGLARTAHHFWWQDNQAAGTGQRWVIEDNVFVHGITADTRTVFEVRKPRKFVIRRNVIFNAYNGLLVGDTPNTNNTLADNLVEATNVAYQFSNSQGGSRGYNNRILGTPATPWSGTLHSTDWFSRNDDLAGKESFYDVPPVSQPALTADLLDSLQALGLIASGAGDTPLNLSAGAILSGPITANGAITAGTGAGSASLFADGGAASSVSHSWRAANTTEWTARMPGAVTQIRFEDSNGGTGEYFRLDRSAQTVTAFKTMQTKRIKNNQGSALVAGDFALSAGWGTTATVGTITGTDQGAQFTITSSGTGQAANPTCTLTFKDGTWTNAPIVVVQRQDRANQPTVVFTWTVTATTLVLTFVGTPVAAETYVVSFVAMGR